MIEVEMKTAKAHDSRQRITNAFRARVARLPGIGMHPALKIDPWVEGYKNFAFGGSAAGHPHDLLLVGLSTIKNAQLKMLSGGLEL